MRKARLLLSSALVCVSLWVAPEARGEDVVPPPDSLVAENIPPVPKSVAESVGRYTEFRAAQFRSWHPKNREMLIRTRFADTLQVHRVNMPLGARTQLTFYPDSVAGASFQPTDGESFLFTKDVGG